MSVGGGIDGSGEELTHSLVFTLLGVVALGRAVRLLVRGRNVGSRRAGVDQSIVWPWHVWLLQNCDGVLVDGDGIVLAGRDVLDQMLLESGAILLVRLEEVVPGLFGGV